MPTEKIPKMPILFICDNCDFECCKNSNWNKHLLTSKHKNLQNPTYKNAENYSCVCGKIYKHSSTYYAHKKKCKPNHPHLEVDDQIDITSLDMNLIMQLLKQNDEFKSLMVEQNNKMMESFQEVCKNNTTSINNGNINSHNKTFNLNVFLNEQCKDAMNIMEFVDTIKLDLSDAESVRKLGYVNGISNIIIKHLKALDIHMRPVHCTDLKRETCLLYTSDAADE